MDGVQCKDAVATATTDGELLAAFATRKDEASFEELIRRHSAMVFNACRRLVRHSSDAEDAAQAVFLALSMRAGDAALHARASLSGWLYESAIHVCLRAREAAQVRARREREAGEMKERVVNAAAEWERLEPVLDGELSALPEKYRLAIVLHHLEQRSVEETAGLIRCSVDAVKQRLSRGREMLKDRLTRSGLALNVALLAALLDQKASTAAPPLGFVSATVQRAVLIVAGKATVGGAVAQQTLALAKAAAEAMSPPKLWRPKRAPVIAGLVLILALIAVESNNSVPSSPEKPVSSFEKKGKSADVSDPEKDDLKPKMDFADREMMKEKEKRAFESEMNDKRPRKVADDTKKSPVGDTPKPKMDFSKLDDLKAKKARNDIENEFDKKAESKFVDNEASASVPKSQAPISAPEIDGVRTNVSRDQK